MSIARSVLVLRLSNKTASLDNVLECILLEASITTLILTVRIAGNQFLFREGYKLMTCKEVDSLNVTRSVF